MNRPDKFCLFLLALEAGIFLASFFSWPKLIIWGSIFFLAVIISHYFLPQNFTFFLILIPTFFLGASYYKISDLWARAQSALYLNGQGEIETRAIIEEEPEIKEYSIWLWVKLLDNFHGKVLIKVFPGEKDFQYGDEIFIKGMVKEPVNSTDFNLKNYLAKKGVYSVMNYPKVKILKNNQASKLKFFLYQFRTSLEKKISTLWPAPEANFLVGLLLGGRANLPDDLKEAMSRSSTSHLTALSGYNITLIATTVLAILLFLGFTRPQSFWFSLIFISLFVVMTGSFASVARAAIMGGIVLFGQKIGRLYNPRNSLLVAGTIMTLFNPKILAFDIGFQLSFGAVLGLLYFAPFFSERLKTKENSFLDWRENLALTLSAQVTVLPLIIFYFGFLSFVSPLSNILILAAIPITMLVGFLAMLISFISPFLSWPFALITEIFLKYELAVINFFGGLKIAGINLGDKKYLFLFCLIILIGFLIYFKLRNK